MTNEGKRTIWQKHIQSLGLVAGSWEETQLRKLARARQKEEERVERYRPHRELEKRLIAMRLDEELKLGEIAKREGISRERVRQILHRVEVREGIKIAHPGRLVPPVVVACAICGADIQKRQSYIKAHQKHYCPLHRYGSKYEYPPNCTTPAEKDRFRSYWRYHNEPDFRAKVLRASIAWSTRMRKEKNPRFMANAKRAVTKYWARIRGNPTTKAAFNKRVSERRKERMRDEPAFREKQLALWRRRNKEDNRKKHETTN